MKNSVPQPIGQEKIVYQGNIIEVVHQDMQIGYKQKTFESARRSPGVRLIIVSPDNKLLMTKEYRTELKEWDYRLPGGKVFDTLEEYNAFLTTGHNMIEKAMEAAVKEAKEEAGLEVRKLEHLATSKCGATIIWDLFYFIVTDYTETKEGQHLESGEHIKVMWIDKEEIKEVCFSGKMQEERSIAVLLRYVYEKKQF